MGSGHHSLAVAWHVGDEFNDADERGWGGQNARTLSKYCCLSTIMGYFGLWSIRYCGCTGSLGVTPAKSNLWSLILLFFLGRIVYRAANHHGGCVKFIERRYDSSYGVRAGGFRLLSDSVRSSSKKTRLVKRNKNR